MMVNVAGAYELVIAAANGLVTWLNFKTLDQIN
jgi:hypothetical protein